MNVTFELVSAAFTEAVGHEPQVGDMALIESAFGRPYQSVMGADAYPTVHLKAAALFQSLVGNHALLDGNKRLAWIAAQSMFIVNGMILAVDTGTAFEWCLSVAANGATVEEIETRFREWTVPA